MTTVKPSQQRLIDALETMRARGGDAQSVGQTADALREALREPYTWYKVTEQILELPRDQVEKLCLLAARRSDALGYSAERRYEGFSSALNDLMTPRGHGSLENDFLAALPEAPSLGDVKNALRTVREQYRPVVDETIVRFCKATDAHIDAIAEALWSAPDGKTREIAEGLSVADGGNTRQELIERVRQPRFQKLMWMNYGIVAPSANRVAWLERASNGKDVSKLPTAQRVWAGTDFADDQVHALLYAGIDGAVGHYAQASPTFDAKTRDAYLARVRDLNNVLFTGTCVELAERIAKLTPESREPPRDRDRSFVGAYSERPQATFVKASLGQPWLAKALVLDDGPLKRVDTCVVLPGRKLGGPELFDGDFYVRMPVGDLGPQLAAALAETARLVLPLAYSTGVSVMDYTQVEALTKHFTQVKHAYAILMDGTASVANTIALLLANKLPPPYDTADAALQLLDRSNLVAQVSALSPLGFVAPLTAVGFVPTKPLELIQRDGIDYARLPADLEQLMHDGRAAQKQALRDGTKIPSGSGVTGRGCPVAGRGPIRNADGKVDLTAEAGLSILTHAMIQLTRQVLKEQQA